MDSTRESMIVLAGDIGGTRTRLGVFSSGGRTRPNLEFSREYNSEALDSLESAVRDFLSNRPEKIDAAVFAAAGPVIDGKTTLTNLAWGISATSLMQVLGLKSVELVNDQVGLACFIAGSEAGDHFALNEKPVNPRGPVAILAPGTGLGEGYMTWNGDYYQPFPSEGGHADFAPVTSQQQRLLEYMLARYDRVSIERVCSGMGMANLYSFLRDVGGLEEPDWLREQISNADDPTPIVVAAAQSDSRPSDLCWATVALFIELLAQEAGNLALKILPTGGLYLGGGISPRVLGELTTGFMKPFVAKGRMGDLLGNIPVFVVTHPQPTLFGAAQRALQLVAGF